MYHAECVAILYAAKEASGIGVKVKCKDPHRVLQILRKTRDELKDVSLAGLHFYRSRTEPETEIWILKEPEDAKEQGN